ncbi:MAG: hypothetical protein VYC34_00895, partial [Planctomycetota bacterium]|nr:hypothetical protein [Planctomycetota bacterium]
GADQAAVLECERLGVTMKPPADPGPDGGFSNEIQLLRAEASGAVYAALASGQLIADRLFYDAEQGVAEAAAAPGNLVTFFESSTGVPATGAVLRWDLIKDRLQWLGAGEMTLGR